MDAEQTSAKSGSQPDSKADSALDSNSDARPDAAASSQSQLEATAAETAPAPAAETATEADTAVKAEAPTSSLESIEASLHLHPPGRDGGRRSRERLRRNLHALLRHRVLRRFAIGGVAAMVLGGVFVGAMLWRLSSGPIEMNIVTPYLAAAIGENFGPGHKVSIGGTQIERDEKGGAALRIRDISVRDGDGVVVASAPKAEVGLSGAGLLSGRVRASSLNLVGAEMKVRIETDGRVTVFAGAETRPLATALVPAKPAPPTAPPPPGQQPAAANRTGFEPFAALFSWIDGMGASGLDGYELSELGLKSGNLVVDDQRDGKRWKFTDINLSLTRPMRGGVRFRLGSDNPERPWRILASVTPKGDNLRTVVLDARKVSSRDIVLATRAGEGYEADLLLSASIRGEISTDGTPEFIDGQILAESGYIADLDVPEVRIDIDRAEFGITWDAVRKSLVVPFRIQASDNQIAMVARVESMRDESGIWNIEINRPPVIDPIILGGPGTEPIALNRAVVRARIDTLGKRLILDQADLGRSDFRPAYNFGLAVSGALDYSTDDPKLALGVAATKMSMTALKRLWPPIVAPKVRAWVDNHLFDGSVDRVVIALNSPTSAFRANGPSMAEDALSVEMETTGTSVVPVDTLPPIRDADLSVRVTGRAANVGLGRGTIEVSPGRRLSVTSGAFEVTDMRPKDPPARARFRVDGSLAAVSELMATEGLRDVAGEAFDTSTARGNVAAQITLGLPLKKDLPKNAVTYSANLDISNFVGEKMFLGQKVESPLLKVTANAQGYQIRGDTRINGTAGVLEYRKGSGEAAAEVRLQAQLDEAARNRLGIDFGPALSGTLPVKISGRVGGKDDTRFSGEADLTPVKIDNLLPGWVKPPGKAAQATFIMSKVKNNTRFDEIKIDAPGAQVRGNVELDDDGDIISANFPVFAVSEGDKVSLKADRGPEGVLRAVVRGDIYDGRNFIKTSLSGTQPETGKKRKQADLDLDVKLGVIAGHNGEALRSLDLKLSRRGGRIRSFALNAKVGRDTPLIGDMRTRLNNGRQVIYFESNDAGALFRFADLYPRMYGGRVQVGMDPPNQDGTPQDGAVNIANFQVRDERALDRVASGAPGGARRAVDFSQARAEFVRTPGRTTVRDGVVRGPVVGATIEGNIDYLRDEVHMRGTFIPLYGLNNMFGQIPVLGYLIGGGPNEGLLGVSFEVTGPPGNPRVTPNPISAIAPGALRKIFELRPVQNDGFTEPGR